MAKRYYSKLSAPYQRPNKNKVGRPPLRECIHRIAYTATMRGIEDDIPTLLFLGAPYELLQDVGTAICRMMDGNIRDIIITPERAIIFRNGKEYWRWAVGIIGLDETFINYPEFVKFFIHKMTTTANCKVRHYKLDTFLNL